MSQDALWCIINILPKGFSSGQQHLAPAYAQVIQLQPALNYKQRVLNALLTEKPLNISSILKSKLVLVNFDKER